jgi:hypothetical protein
MNYAIQPITSKPDRERPTGKVTPHKVQRNKQELDIGRPHPTVGLVVFMIILVTVALVDIATTALTLLGS